MNDFHTAGERLVGRRLHTEHRAGVRHYVTGQHAAEVTRPDVLETLVGEPDDPLVLAATLTYVDQTGHAVCAILTKEERDHAPGYGWYAVMVARAGQNSVQPWSAPPENFTLSDKMRDALKAAERLALGDG